MSVDERMLALIEGIYEAGAEPTHWPVIVSRIAAHFAARVGSMWTYSPDLVRAVRFTRKLAALDAQLSVAIDLLDHTPSFLLVVDSRRTIRLATSGARAVLDRRRSLLCRHGRLAASDSVCDALLQAALERATREQGARPGTILMRDDHGLVFKLSLTPLPASRGPLFDGARAAMIVAEPETPSRSPPIARERAARDDAPDASPSVPPEAARAVRNAFRHVHETVRLQANPLLGWRTVRDGAADDAARITSLRALLQACAATLADNERTEPLHRVLLHTYLKPAPNQLAAADRARMPFGSYRRQLRAALAEATGRLWLAEQARRERTPQGD